MSEIEQPITARARQRLVLLRDEFARERNHAAIDRIDATLGDLSGAHGAPRSEADQALLHYTAMQLADELRVLKVANDTAPPTNQNPPSAALWLIATIAGEKVRDAILGDLEEQFVEETLRYSAPRARRNYTIRALVAAGHLLKSRYRDLPSKAARWIFG